MDGTTRQPNRLRHYRINHAYRRVFEAVEAAIAQAKQQADFLEGLNQQTFTTAIVGLRDVERALMDATASTAWIDTCSNLADMEEQSLPGGWDRTGCLQLLDNPSPDAADHPGTFHKVPCRWVLAKLKARATAESRAGES